MFVSMHVFLKGARSSEGSYTSWMREVQKWTRGGQCRGGGGW